MMVNKEFNLVLLGPPGAGKGTQAGYLTKAYHLLHVSTGDMLREAVKEGTETGIEAEKYMNSGELVPDSVVTRIMVERMAKPDAAGGVIFDGYPRTVPQAKSLDDALIKEERSLNVVLYFETTEKVAIERLSGRRVCGKCNKNYHVTNMPPTKDGICDVCGGELIQREDDKPETVKNRLTVYKERTKDLIEYYMKKGLLREVNGDLPAKQLFDDIDALFRQEGLINDGDNGQ